MKSISLKLQDRLFQETELLLTNIEMSRNKYINEAIDHYNKFQRRGLIEEQLIKESKLVKSDSMHILNEFGSQSS